MIAVPNQGKPTKDTLTALATQTERAQLSKNYEFKIPQLKVGTLDTLMALSDDLAKYDTQIGAIAKKIEKTYFDLQNAEVDESAVAKTAAASNKPAAASAALAGPQQLRVNNTSPQEFVQKFAWNEVRYPKRSPLKTLTDLIVKEALKTDEVLKKQVAEYNEFRGQYAALDRKDTGTLLVKPLHAYIKKQDIIDSEHLISLFVVVPRAKQDEFESQYETMELAQREKEKQDKLKRDAELKEREVRDAERLAKLMAQQKAQGHEIDESAVEKHNHTIDDKTSASSTTSADAELAALSLQQQQQAKKPLPACRLVVPRSAKLLANITGEEFLLYRIICLKDGEELIKTVCRERRYTVRPFTLNESEEKEEKQRKAELLKKKKALWAYLLRWCLTSYSECEAAWIHLKAIRLYVEAVLRYGLPVDLTAALLEPAKGKDKALRAALKSLYARLSGGAAAHSGKDGEDEIDSAAFGAAGEFYPYVYLPLNLTD